MGLLLYQIGISFQNLSVFPVVKPDISGICHIRQKFSYEDRIQYRTFYVHTVSGACGYAPGRHATKPSGCRETSRQSEKCPPPADSQAVRVQNKKEDYIIRHIVREKIKNLKQILAMINDALEKAPEGGLKIKQRESKIYYYQQIRNDNKCAEYYLHKQDAELIKQLADKGYYIKLKPFLEKELQLLEDFAHAYNEQVVDDIYDSMTEARK